MRCLSPGEQKELRFSTIWIPENSIFQHGAYIYFSCKSEVSLEVKHTPPQSISVHNKFHYYTPTHLTKYFYLTSLRAIYQPNCTLACPENTPYSANYVSFSKLKKSKFIALGHAILTSLGNSTKKKFGSIVTGSSYKSYTTKITLNV